MLRDPLTSLPNGTLFNERLAAALRRPDPVDVLLLNVDDFKNLNDMLGRSSADELLVEVASRLRNCVRPHDTVARLGGDEFVVLLTECLNADAVAKRIAESLYEPLRVGGSLVRPGVSMGLASRTSRTLDGAELLRQADAAMTAAKTGGKNAWLRFRPEMLNTVAAKADGQAGLRQAVELGQISVHYQPVVSPGLGAVVQFEAFARWERHGRLVPPNQFLPVAEQSGLIREIGDEVMRRACAEIRPWLAGDAAYSVAVNVSGLQFQNRDFATDVLAIVASTGVDPRQLMLELTESVFFESDSDVLRQLRQLREAGVRIAMDDFGTGLRVPGPAQGAAAGQGQDRPLLCGDDQDRPGTAAVLRHHDQRRARPGPEGHGRGHRDAGPGPVPDGPRLRLPAGLPVRQAGPGQRPGRDDGERADGDRQGRRRAVARRRSRSPAGSARRSAATRPAGLRTRDAPSGPAGIRGDARRVRSRDVVTCRRSSSSRSAPTIAALRSHSSRASSGSYACLLAFASARLA